MDADYEILITGIYVVSTEDKWPCKIGITSDLRKRLTGLQVGCWHKLIPYSFNLAGKVSGNMPKVLRDDYNGLAKAAAGLESECHKALKGLDLHLRGEWFDVDVEAAHMVLQKVAANNGYTVADVAKVLDFDSNRLVIPEEKYTHRLMIESMAENYRFITECAQGIDGTSET